MMSINERVQMIVDKLFDGNVSEFERSSGIRPYTIKNIVGSRQTKPSYDILELMARNNVQISSEWLLRGEGEMLKDSSNDGDQDEKNITKQDIEQIEKENIKYLRQINTLYEKITSLQDMIITLKDQLSNQAESEEEPKNKLLSQLINEAVEEFEERASGEEYSDIEKNVG